MVSERASNLRVVTSALLAIAILPGPAMCQAHATGQRKLAGKKSYLLLVTFYGFAQVGRLSNLNQSPYDGMAVPLVDAYDTGAPPGFQEIHARFAALQRQTQKDLWPWLFLNRMVGTNGTNPQAGKPGFQKIRGLDLDNSTGAQSAFLDIWRTALRQAKATRVPGVVLDMEYYNNYGVNSVADVARERMIPPLAVENQLHQIGDRMAMIAGEEYPDATIWILDTGLSSSSGVGGHVEYQNTRGYLLHGLLDGARSRHLALILVDGGEDSLGYCHPSVMALRDAIRSRRQQFGSLIRAYPGTLQLGGTIALWRNADTRLGWLREGECANTDVQRPEDFSSYMKLLFENYRFVWVYAPVVGRYDPFDPNSSEQVGVMLEHARNKNSKTRSQSESGFGR